MIWHYRVCLGETERAGKKGEARVMRERKMSRGGGRDCACIQISLHYQYRADHPFILSILYYLSFHLSSFVLSFIISIILSFYHCIIPFQRFIMQFIILSFYHSISRSTVRVVILFIFLSIDHACICCTVLSIILFIYRSI